LLLFVVVAGVGAKSVWIPDKWTFKSWRGIEVMGGRAFYWHWHGKSAAGENPATGHTSFRAPFAITEDFWKFDVSDKQYYPELADFRSFVVCMPLWFPLLLLLIAPIRWIIARPANGPAFPVITDATQK
jgi:hypothetical protein